MGLENVKNVVLVLSGKGGVGKSSVTIQLALALTQQGHNVGILDIDLTGPSIPRLLNLEDQKVRQAPGGWLPVRVHEAISTPLSPSSKLDLQPPHNDTTKPSVRTRGSLHALSLAFLLPSRSSAVIWRGPKKTAMIRQFVSDVLWPANTDYLLIDTPPGTSDEHIAIVEELHKLVNLAPPSAAFSVSVAGTVQYQTRLAGAVVVTTPQAISTSDVRKELNFCVKTQVPVLGVIENMAGYMCPCCGEISNVFSKGGGEVMARECNVRFLGSVPIDTGFGALVEGARPDIDIEQSRNGNTEHSNSNAEGDLLVEKYKECGLCPIFSSFAITVSGIVEDVKTGSGTIIGVLLLVSGLGGFATQPHAETHLDSISPPFGPKVWGTECFPQLYKKGLKLAIFTFDASTLQVKMLTNSVNTASLTPNFKSDATIQSTTNNNANGTHFGADPADLPYFDGYKALDSKQNQIRLLQFTSITDETLSCSIEIASLLNTITYSALSYHWSAPPVSQDDLKPIMIDSKPVLLRPSLYSFLKTLAGAYPKLVFFLDVVCINQRDNDERASQVSIMQVIYASAVQVLTWLGDNDMEIRYAFAQVERQQSGQKILKPRAFLDSVVCLFCRPYWTRMWVVQEFTVAKSIKLICGIAIVRWDDLTNAVNTCGSAPEDDPGWDTYRRFQQLRTNYRNQKPSTLVELMQEHRRSRCSDTRDMVYALCGLASDGNAININYHQTPMHLIFQFLEKDLLPTEPHQTYRHAPQILISSANGDKDTMLVQLDGILADHALGLLSSLRPPLRVSRKDMIQCMEDKNKSTNFICRAQLMGYVDRVVPLPHTHENLVNPSPTHALQDMCIQVSSKPMRSLPSTRLFDDLMSGDSPMKFQGSSAVSEGDMVVKLHDLYLVLPKDSNEPLLVEEMTDDELKSVFGRKVSTLSFDDIYFLQELCRRCIRRCTRYDEYCKYWTALVDTNVHVSPVFFFALMYATSDSWISWTLLQNFYQEVEDVEPVSHCLCTQAPAEGDLIDRSLMDYKPTQFPRHVVPFVGHGQDDEDKKAYVRSIEISTKKRKEHYYTRHLERVQENGLLTFKQWYQYLHNKWDPCERWDQHQEFWEPSSYQAGKRWSLTPNFSCDLLSNMEGFGGFLSREKDLGTRLKLCTTGPQHGTWLELQSNDTLHPGLISRINLDAIIMNRNGSFKWIEAINDVDELEDMIGWGGSRRLMVAAPGTRDFINETQERLGEKSTLGIKTLRYVQDGRFSDTSRNVHLSTKGLFLQGELRCEDGTYRHSRLKLGERLVLAHDQLRYTFLHQAGVETNGGQLYGYKYIPGKTWEDEMTW